MSEIIECPLRPEYGRCISQAAEGIIDAEAFKGARFYITGATGMVGGALSRALLYLNRKKNLGIKLVLPIRRSSSLSRLQGIADRSEVRLIETDLEENIDLGGEIDYIVHAASPTLSRELKENSASSIRSIALGGLNLLEFARRKRVRGMVYLSSMEVYGALYGEAAENTLGFIDLTSPRSCYPEGKRFIENACACYAAEFNVNVCSARLAQVMSAGIKPDESRAYAQFARSALRGESIVLKTQGTSNGNYVHIADAVTAICQLVLKGEKGQSYNVCSDDCTLTIKELALRISALLSNGKSAVISDAPKDPSSLPYAPETGIRLSNQKLKRLGWQSLFGIDDMIASLGKDIRDLQSL